MALQGDQVLTRRPNSELAREKMWSRIHLIPVLQAEEDRDLVRRHLAEKARERELLGGETKVYNNDRYVLGEQQWLGVFDEPGSMLTRIPGSCDQRTPSLRATRRNRREVNCKERIHCTYHGVSWSDVDCRSLPITIRHQHLPTEFSHLVRTVAHQLSCACQV